MQSAKSILGGRVALTVPSTLVVTPVPFLDTAIHLGIIIRGEGETLQLAMGSNITSDDEILEGEFLELPLSGTRILDLVVNNRRKGVGCVRIILNNTGVPLVEEVLELLVPFSMGIIGIGSKR